MYYLTCVFNLLMKNLIWEEKMNEQNYAYYGDEIDIKALILVLWSKKHIIIAVTLLLAIFSGLMSFFILPSVYETKVNIVINMPDIYSTKYGNYTLPITTNDEYINLIFSNDVLLKTIKDMEYDGVSVEKLNKRISKEQVNANQQDKNIYEITVSAGDPEESLKLAQTLYKNYIEFLDVMIKERAVRYFYNHYNIQIEALNFDLEKTKELLRKNEALLAETPKTINQKEAVQAIKDDFANISDFVVLEKIINPNYTKIESDIISNRQTIANIEETISEYKKYLTELEEEKKSLDEYYKSKGAIELNSNLKGIVETNIYLPSDPIAPGQKSSPHNFRNAAIGGVLGGMISVLVVLVKYYWFESEKHQKIQTAYNFNIDKQ